MKSTDEIKKAMLHCSPVSCRSNDCPYKDDTPKYEGDMPVCRMKLWHDMRHLIQQLEAERDALIKYITDSSWAACDICKHGIDGASAMNCKHIREVGVPCFEWRGVQREDGNA